MVSRSEEGMSVARYAPKRRPPPPDDRYRALARTIQQKRARRPLPPLFRGLAWGLVLATAVLVADASASSVNATVASIGSWLGSVVPSFGATADRKIEVQLNGTTATVKFDAVGHFAVPLTLKDGPNHIIVALIGPASETISTTGLTVTLDRTPPPLTLSKPKNGDTIDSTTLTVEGKAEPGAIVLVNDRSVIVGQDGGFSDSVTVQAGALPITVIARDRAGNETKTQLSVTVRPVASPGVTTTVGVTLASTTVKPGGYVLANISVTNAGVPQAGVTVSLQVGVFAVGTAVTDASGRVGISFAAPPNEGTAQVIVLAGPASGSALLTIAK